MKQEPTEEFLAILRAVLRNLPGDELMALRTRLIRTQEHPQTLAVVNAEIRRRKPPAVS